MLRKENHGATLLIIYLIYRKKVSRKTNMAHQILERYAILVKVSVFTAAPSVSTKMRVVKNSPFEDPQFKLLPRDLNLTEY